MLCNATDSMSRCARGCEQAISKRDVSMIGSGSKQYLMTQGPLKRSATREEDTVEGNVGMFLYARVLVSRFMVLLLLFLFLVFVFVLFCFVLFCFLLNNL